MEKAELPWMATWLFYFKESGMMKINITIFLLLVLLGFPVPTNAIFIDLGNGISQDDRRTATVVDDNYWIQDLNRFVEFNI
jgi:hypothetical protein